MPDVTVLVVNYRTEAMTGEAIAAARAAAGPLSIEVVVVDNGSTPESAQRLRDAAPGATIVEEAENRGFAAGVNAGLRVASAPRVLLLNSDAFPRDDAVARLARYLDDHPRAGLVAPRLLHPDGRVQVNAYKRLPSLLTLFFDFAAPLHPLDGTPLHPHALPKARLARSGPVAHVMGAAMMVRRAAADAVGPLDEQFFLYLEETDWQRRMAAAGWEIHLEPEAAVVHMERGSSGHDVVSPHYLRSAQRYFGPRARGVMRAGARISVLSARAAGRLRPGDPRFPKLERGYREVLERL